ncbi:DNA-binding protein [Pseudoclavibacter chungangensis]|uniref:DNA-binding protein n=1 Tax=Pseudoclavibacter chungangensis TaxID=587635 RepID=A0A7J5BZP6_9MICO|nr:Rv2175c family DNA-binding protein [Pseudoclavibacter chungangensis]KAB1660098.1 DNA-binding protein [Pseudoclavibacter chungangensis]NYJ66799.1 excisionase family DNA binding protein [Pseudoclavibacter chungangensis]
MSDSSIERQWLTIPEAAEQLGLSKGKVGRLVQERFLLARRIDGEPRIPADFIHGGEPLHGLRGTLTLLFDGGLRDDEVLDWMLAVDETLGQAPVDALRAGRRTSVRHSVQLLGL